MFNPLKKMMEQALGIIFFILSLKTWSYGQGQSAGLP